MNRKILLLSAFVVVAFAACRESYDPPIISSPIKHLVVEGVLNAGAGPTSIRLTRTFKLDDTAKVTGELNAQVSVEGKDGSTRQLVSAGSGRYTSANLNLTIGQEYRLRIRTSNGKDYQSEWVTALLTPAIDSIGWTRNEEGVTMYVNTHDQTNNTRYYRWEYDDTWEIRSYYFSRYLYTGSFVRERVIPAEQVWQCWKYGFSSDIILASSARLQSDVIFQAPVKFVPEDDEKMCVRYSMLLRQYALDKKGYEFYELMKRNTENIGTVFDPQPSEIRGNIQCLTDPTELVIGYIGASTITQKRAFVDNVDLQGWHIYQQCEDTDVPDNVDSLRVAALNGLSPIDAIYSQQTGLIIGYTHSTRVCVECTYRGGSNVKPSYW